MGELNKLDNCIMRLLVFLKILEPVQLNDPNAILLISNSLNIRTYFYKWTTGVSNIDGNSNIFLCKHQSKQQVWQDYGKALGHLLLLNNVDNLPFDFDKLTEEELKEFAYHLCVPTFMLEQLNNINVQEITKAFNVKSNFAEKKISLYEDTYSGVISHGQLSKI